MSLRPDVNDLVQLRDSEGREYRSRVEASSPDLLTVGRPFDLAADHDLRPGATLMVRWTCARGIAVIPVRLVAAFLEGTLPMWSMVVTGDGWIEQRRRYVRVPATGPVRLQMLDNDAPVEPIAGHLVDVSEGGVRCSVEALAAARLPHECAVSASFSIGDRIFTPVGRIGFRRVATHAAGLTELVVVFDEPVKDADALRKQIYAQQLRAPRTRPGST